MDVKEVLISLCELQFWNLKLRNTYIVRLNLLVQLLVIHYCDTK